MGSAMARNLGDEAGRTGLVHDWRVSQLKRLGIPPPLADAYADHLDWHQIAHLVQRGCPTWLALRIVR
jgi:hypothetical protein